MAGLVRGMCVARVVSGWARLLRMAEATQIKVGAWLLKLQTAVTGQRPC